jgi:hypothetical protein
VAGPACQWPTTAHGNVSRPACPRASREATVARARRCWPSRATCPSWSHALPCVLIPSQCCFIKTKKPFASSSPRLCSLLRSRAAPRCRASSPTGAALPHLKPPRQSLVRHGPPPSWSRHRAAVLCEKAPLHWVAAASAEGLTVECRHRPWNWCPSGTLSSAVAPRCSKAPPTPLATTGRSPHQPKLRRRATACSGELILPDAPQSSSSTSGLALATALAHLSDGCHRNPATSAAPRHELSLPCFLWRMGHQPKWLGQLKMG